MARERYRQRLERLREAVVAVGDLVAGRLDDAVTASITCDRTLAESVIDGDHEINRRYLSLEHECLELIALQQPLAGDLRLVVAAFKIVTDLERLGDLAVNLAQYARESNGCAIPDVDFERLTSLAREQVETAVDAFASDDAAACLRVASRDEELDRRCEAVSERVLRAALATRLSDVSGEGQADETLEDTLRTLVLVRDLERVGDHAVNVAAWTYYALENDERLLV